jgi:nucleoid-associated protein YgaU
MEYTVKPGDTLSHIAQRFLGQANRWPEIFRLNEDAIIAEQTKRPPRKGPRSDYIYCGQVLKIPTLAPALNNLKPTIPQDKAALL